MRILFIGNKKYKQLLLPKIAERNGNNRSTDSFFAP
jgi:hypothetical protein